MKFGRLLRTTSKDQPEIEALFAAYKSLKKQVKRLPYKEQLGQQGTMETLSEEENNFVKALSDTLAQLNEMFLEKEENSVIRVEHLEHKLAAQLTPEQLNELHKQFVDFHGEVLLLVHWSILAYTATVKILKKHHKRTGLLVRAPELGNLLSQPFCSTELMTSIAHRVEDDIQQLAERMGVSGQRTSEPTEQQQQQQQGGAAVQGGAAAAAAVAAAVAAGDALAPQLSNGGLDLKLLQRLADSGSVTTQSDTEATLEEDTGRSNLQQQQQQQQQQECSQQARLRDQGSVSEVQSRMKRRRMEHVGTSASHAPGTAGKFVAGVAGLDGQSGAGAGAAAAGHSQQLYTQHEQQPQQHKQQQSLAGEMLNQQEQQEANPGDCSAAAAPYQLQQQQQEQQLEAAQVPTLVPQRGSVTGAMDSDHHHHQQQQPMRAGQAISTCAAAAAIAPGPAVGPGAAALIGSAGPADAGSSSPAAKGSIMRQTQVALTTWRHLQCTASTPSTVVPRFADANAAVAGTVLTESSAA